MRPYLTLSLWLLSGFAVSAQDAKDPYQWLEDVTGEKALAWVKERNAKSTGELTKRPEFKALNERLLKILDSKDRIPYISKRGTFYYNFWRDEKNKRGLWRRTTLEEYRKDKPKWETVLDLDELAAEEKENWVWGGANFLQPKYERCLISLSRGGADATVVREFDVTSKEFVKDGFTLPEAKSHVVVEGHRHALRRHRLRPGLADQVRLSADRQGVEARHQAGRRQARLRGQAGRRAAGRRRGTRRQGFEREFASRGDHVLHERDVRPPRTASSSRSTSRTTPTSASTASCCSSRSRTEWKVGGKTYPAGSLLATNFEAFLKGKRNFDVLFEPTERKSLGGLLADAQPSSS